jgi:hypothetical protein
MSLYAGILARLCGRYEESERHLLRAAEVNDRIQAPFFLARTHLESARLYKERGQADDPIRQAHHLALAVPRPRARPRPGPKPGAGAHRCRGGQVAPAPVAGRRDRRPED